MMTTTHGGRRTGPPRTARCGHEVPFHPGPAKPLCPACSPKPLAPIGCVRCGLSFVPKMKTQRSCCGWSSLNPRRPHDGCSVPDCDNPHRAKGLCSTHYNDLNYSGDERYGVGWIGCAACGTPIRRPVITRRQPACSVVCRTIIEHGVVVDVGTYNWTTDAMQRARRAGADVVERIDRDRVLRRDGFRCYLCGWICDPDLSIFDPRCPTIDHVVPLSAGGQHTWTNVRCACLGCNSSKGARLLQPV